MVLVPPFLLRTLYVKGSLRNIEGGFEFQLRNKLGSGYAHALQPLAVDGKEVPADLSFFVVDDTETAFAAVRKEKPVTLAVNKTSAIRVRGEPLSSGAHKVQMGFVVAGLGTLSFDFTDTIAD
jgi:hydroxymethylglutaryl-CoA reductase (NADPH)